MRRQYLGDEKNEQNSFPNVAGGLRDSLLRCCGWLSTGLQRASS